MGEFTYENQGTKTYLVYKIDQEDSLDSLSLGMLTNNSIQGLAPTVFTQMDEDRFIKYDVTSKVSVHQFFAASVNRKRLLGVLNGIVDAVQSAEEYMIDIHSLVMDLNYMFSDVSTCNTVLVCLPVLCGSEQKTDYGQFIKNIMVNTSFDQTESCDYVAAILNYLNSSPVFSFSEFKRLLIQLEKQESNKAVKQPQNVKTPQRPTVKAPAGANAGKDRNTPNGTGKNITRNPKELPGGNGAKKPETPEIPKPKVKSEEPQPAQKKISLFTVMAHYSKENWELYKSQKNEKPTGHKSSGKPPKKKKTEEASSKPKTDFEVPGVKKDIVIAPPKINDSEIGRQETVKSGVESAPLQPNVQAESIKKEPVITKPVPNDLDRERPHGDFGNTTVLSGPGSAGETTVLNSVAPEPKALCPYLVRVKNGKRIDINKPVFRIGKERSYVDCFIGDNSAISRSHADIIDRGGRLFIMDINSTNHTYVNGQLVPSNGEQEIVDGDIIRLANEEFEFHIS